MSELSTFTRRESRVLDSGLSLIGVVRERRTSKQAQQRFKHTQDQENQHSIVYLMKQAKNRDRTPIEPISRYI